MERPRRWVGGVSVTLVFDEGTANEVEFTDEAFNVSIRRGRSLEADVFNPGGGTIRVRNYNANFNPYFLTDTSALLLESGDNLLLENGDKLLLEYGNGSGAGTYGDIDLGRKVTIKDGSVAVFTGYVEDFDYDYSSASKRSEATLTIRDGLGALGATTLREWVPTEGQMTGARVSDLLDRDEVGFPSGASNRDIATGTQPLSGGRYETVDGEQEAIGSFVTAGTNALQELQSITKAESGRCFVATDGKLTFQDRYAAFGQSVSATFSDDGADLPFRDIGVRYGTELLHFQVTVRLDNGDESVERNDSLIAGYPNLGVRNLAVGPVPLASSPYATGLASFLLERFQTFSAVVSDLSVALGRLSPSDRATVCGLDIGDTIEVRWTPPGTSGAVTQTLVIDGVGYTARESKNGEGVTANATITFQLSDASDPGYFQVNTDSVNGSAVLAP